MAINFHSDFHVLGRRRQDLWPSQGTILCYQEWFTRSYLSTTGLVMLSAEVVQLLRSISWVLVTQRGGDRDHGAGHEGGAPNCWPIAKEHGIKGRTRVGLGKEFTYRRLLRTERSSLRPLAHVLINKRTQNPKSFSRPTRALLELFRCKKHFGWSRHLKPSPGWPRHLKPGGYAYLLEEQSCQHMSGAHSQAFL